MCVARGCRAVPAEGGQWQSHGPLQWVPPCAAGRVQTGTGVVESTIFERPLDDEVRGRLAAAGPGVGAPGRLVDGLGADPHAVTAALAGEGGERLDERAADATAARRLVHRELVEEHLRPLVRV